jgi:serine/threonine-protein kinase
MKRVACVLAIVVAAPLAWAQNAPEATRLFAEGQALVQAGQYEAACAKFEGSLKAGAGVGTMLYLGDCYEHVSRPSSAFAMYQGAAALAQAHQDEREATARELASKIRPRVSWVTLRFAAARPRGYEMRRDGTLIANAELDSPIPADPGPHMLEARAFDKIAWRGTFRVDGEATTVRVDVPDLVAVAPVVITRTSSGKTQRTLGLVFGGIGLAAIGVGAGLGIYALAEDARTKNPNDPDNYCNDASRTCATQGAALRQDAMNIAHGVDVTLAVGIAAVLGGFILFFTAPKNREARVGIRTLTLTF